MTNQPDYCEPQPPTRASVRDGLLFGLAWWLAVAVLALAVQNLPG